MLCAAVTSAPSPPAPAAQLATLPIDASLATAERVLLAGNPLARCPLLALLRAPRLRELSLPPQQDTQELNALRALLPWLRLLPCC